MIVTLSNQIESRVLKSKEKRPRATGSGARIESPSGQAERFFSSLPLPHQHTHFGPLAEGSPWAMAWANCGWLIVPPKPAPASSPPPPPRGAAAPPPAAGGTGGGPDPVGSRNRDTYTLGSAAMDESAPPAAPPVAPDTTLLSPAPAPPPPPPVSDRERDVFRSPPTPESALLCGSCSLPPSAEPMPCTAALAERRRDDAPAPARAAASADPAGSPAAAAAAAALASIRRFASCSCGRSGGEGGGGGQRRAACCAHPPALPPSSSSSKSSPGPSSPRIRP